MKKFETNALASIGDLGRQFSDATILMHEAIARKAGLSGTDHKYLGILMRHGAMTAGELSRFTGLTTGAITGLIDRLEKKKLVKRQIKKDDRRIVLIVPDAERAQRLLGKIFADFQSKILHLLSTYDDKEINIIGKYLTSAIEIMKETTATLNNN